MVQKIAGHEPARKIGDMRVAGKIAVHSDLDRRLIFPKTVF